MIGRLFKALSVGVDPWDVMRVGVVYRDNGIIQPKIGNEGSHSKGIVIVAETKFLDDALSIRNGLEAYKKYQVESHLVCMFGEEEDPHRQVATWAIESGQFVAQAGLDHHPDVENACAALAGSLEFVDAWDIEPV